MVKDEVCVENLTESLIQLSQPTFLPDGSKAPINLGDMSDLIKGKLTSLFRYYIHPGSPLATRCRRFHDILTSSPDQFPKWWEASLDDHEVCLLDISSGDGDEGEYGHAGDLPRVTIEGITVKQLEGIKERWNRENNRRQDLLQVYVTEGDWKENRTEIAFDRTTSENLSSALGEACRSSDQGWKDVDLLPVLARSQGRTFSSARHVLGTSRDGDDSNSLDYLLCRAHFKKVDEGEDSAGSYIQCEGHSDIGDGPQSDDDQTMTI